MDEQAKQGVTRGTMRNNGEQRVTRGTRGNKGNKGNKGEHSILSDK